MTIIRPDVKTINGLSVCKGTFMMFLGGQSKCKRPFGAFFFFFFGLEFFLPK